jgi:outer membrane protein OmpA-like peptidoglycan-associated protein
LNTLIVPSMSRKTEQSLTLCATQTASAKGSFMNSSRKAFFALLAAITLSMLVSMSASANEVKDLNVEDSASTAAAPDPPPPPQLAAPAGADDSWRGAVSIYGWFPGTHGTVGILGHDAGVHAPFSDVFRFLKGVIPIAVEVNKGRFVMPFDFFWVKLGDDRALPLTDLGQTSINLHTTESVFTPKFGYRIVDAEHLKVDALAGIRYWYTSLNLRLEPSGIGYTQSANWVDGLGGARFIVPLGPKAAITVGGDAGGGGANLDYQVIGLFTYDFSPKLGLGLGWRYLDVDYRGNHQFIYDIAQTGALAGIYFRFGGRPPVPPTASCSVSPSEVYAGDPVTGTISTQNFNPKHTLTYQWSSTGGKASGTGTTGNVDTTGLQPGSYTVTATATDAKEKKNNVASCSATFTVKARPNYPPTASCSASPSSIAINQSSTITISASSPENRPLTYTWTSTGGQLSGSGTSATLTATNADAGNTMTVTGTATDDHNLSTSCTASVTVPPVQKAAEVEDWGECTFEKDPKRPWRVDNDCKDVLDKLALRVQQMPSGKVAIVGYTEQTEVVNAEQLGAQRAVNIKYYMTTDELGPKVDPTRLEPRKGGTKGKAAHFYFVPQGATLTQEETVIVDESAVKGQPRNAAPAKRKKTTPAPPAQ